MNKIFYNANRVVLLWAALAPFVFTAQNIQAQQATAEAADPKMSSSANIRAVNQGAVEVEDCRDRPLIKNLMAMRTPACNVPAAGPQELTKREVKKLAATATSPEDHLKLAAYFKTQADRLDAEGAGYEEAAAAYRQGPTPKNLIAPNTAARYEYFAKAFREEARSHRTLAASQEQMAKNAGTVADR
jgi:hypothetical protein